MQEIKHFNREALATILYAPDEGVGAKALTLLRERFDVAAEFTITVGDEKSLTQALSSVVIFPLLGKKWLLVIDADKIPLRALPSYMERILYNSCLVVYRTARYGTYKRLQGEKICKQYGPLFPIIDCGRFYVDDVKLLAKMYEVPLTDAWLKFYTKQYGDEPGTLNKLFSMIHAGYVVIDKQSAIAAVGLGKTSTAEFMLKVLHLKPMTAKGMRISQRGVIQYLRDLSLGMDFYTVQNYLMDTLDGFIDIKLSYVLGYITRYKTKDPEYITDEKRKNRYKRLLRYRSMLEEIPLERMLLYRKLYAPLGRDEATVKLSLIRWIMMIYSGLGAQNGAIIPREQHIDTRVPAQATFNLAEECEYVQLKEKELAKLKEKPKVRKGTVKTKAPVTGVVEEDAKPKATTFSEMFEQAGEDVKATLSEG